jgi:hypothetical protein
MIKSSPSHVVLTRRPAKEKGPGGQGLCFWLYRAVRGRGSSTAANRLNH